MPIYDKKNSARIYYRNFTYSLATFRTSLITHAALVLIIISTSVYSSASAAGKGKRWADYSEDTNIESTNLSRKERQRLKQLAKNTIISEPVIAPEPSPEPIQEPTPAPQPEPIEEVIVTDTQAPTIQTPQSITLEASSTAGTIVTYQASATDNIDSTAVVNCLPQSGSLMPIGRTNILCEAVDNAGNTANSSFNVDIVDTSAPNIVIPLGVFGESLDGMATAVYYTVSATDTIDGQVELQCIPASGDLFPLGESSVSCSAQDTSGNQSHNSFAITVYDISPPEPEPVSVRNINVSWQAPLTRIDGSPLYINEISSYEIYYSSNENFTNGTLISVPATNQSGDQANQTIIEAMPTGAYYFAIGAIDKDGIASDFSEPLSLLIP